MQNGQDRHYNPLSKHFEPDITFAKVAHVIVRAFRHDIKQHNGEYDIMKECFKYMRLLEENSREYEQSNSSRVARV